MSRQIYLQDVTISLEGAGIGMEQNVEAYKKGSGTGCLELHKVELYYGEAAAIANR
ncbi:MAG: hypothetical protein ACI9XB_001908 [Gammaproteobacteria bacterium]